MSEWKEHNGKLEKLFVFKNFKEALHFVNEVGGRAERVHHHPDITMRNYKEVLISTNTHDKGNTITEKDYALAKAIDMLTEAPSV